MVPRNPGLLKLIQNKQEYTWQPSIAERRMGFKGWHQRGYLPHFDAPYVTQMVTFMLEDSFPVTQKAEWEPLTREPNSSLKRRKLEAWLDRGHGDCLLAREEFAAIVEHTLREGDGREFQLQAWTIMPNHVHLVVDVWEKPLAHLIKAWKGKSARLVNLALHRINRLWQKDYYDTLIRDTGHLAKAIRYIDQNPAKAKLLRDPKAWRWSSARLRDEFGKLSKAPGMDYSSLHAGNAKQV